MPETAGTVPEAAKAETVAVNVTLAPEAIVVLDVVRVVVVAVAEFVVPVEELEQPAAQNIADASRTTAILW
jgi:hypothetical protein